jgi:hypothetical protein
MPGNKHQDLHLAEVRRLAQEYSAETIEKCLQQEIDEGSNPCYSDTEVEAVMNVLAKSEFVRSQMEQGKKVGEAIRELGKRIRAIQG